MRDPSATHRSQVSSAAAATSQRLQSPSPTSRSSAWVRLSSLLSAASLHSWNVQVKYEGTEISIAVVGKCVEVG